MRHFFAPSAALLAILAPVPALADLSALDVWNNWKSYLEDTGYEIGVGAQDTVGTSLILRDVALSMPSVENTMRATVANLEFREMGNGSVEITMADAIPVAMSAAEAGGVDFTMFLRQSGLTVTASGDPDDITYDFAAQSMAIDFDQFIVEGDAVEPDLRFAMTGIAGQSNVRRDDGWHAAGYGNVDTLTGTMDFQDPNSGDQVSMQFSMANLRTTSDTMISDGFDAMDPASIFTGGMTASGKMSFGDMQFSMSLTGEEAFELSAAAESQEVSFALADGAIAYDALAKGVVYGFSSPQMPFPPISVSIDETEGALLFPLAQSDEFRDFRLMFGVKNLATEDFLWSMIDPGGQLPHDPASLRIDVSGKLRVLGDIFDAEAVAMMEDEVPFEIDSVTIGDLSLSIAGAALNAVGQFAFDNTDLETFDGMPAPSGDLNVDIFGLNGLMDTLVSMGLIPQDQAMGARMMLGAFARPGDGEDHLQSTIEIHEDGSVFANGMQLQ